MMCYAHHLAPTGDHVMRTVKTITLMYFVIYLLGINKSYLMIGSLVVNNKNTCLREKVKRSTRIEDVPMVLALERNVSTRKLN